MIAKGVSDKEHAEMIRLYIEEELGINKIAEILGRSSRTPLVQIQRHNKAIERNNVCPVCQRNHAEYSQKPAKRVQYKNEQIGIEARALEELILKTY